MIRPASRACNGFTLIEVILASVAGALVLVAVYGVFQQAIRLRDGAVRRINDSRQRTRAANIVRNDLRNALISGGLFASIVEGSSTASDGMNSSDPGYLKITTTTGKDTDDALFGDVQEVEYYVVRGGTFSSSGEGGSLVRTVTRDLLDTDEPETVQEQVMDGVESFQVSFYDGTNWQPSWSFNTADSGTSSSTSTSSASSSSGNSGETEALPLAIRVDIQQAAQTPKEPAPAPIEILVPWTTQPFTSPTPSPTASPS